MTKKLFIDKTNFHHQMIQCLDIVLKPQSHIWNKVKKRRENSKLLNRYIESGHQVAEDYKTS